VPAAQRRLAAGVLAGALIALLSGPVAAQEPAPSDSSTTEILLQLRIDGGPAEVVSALGRDTLTLIPVRRFLELAEIRPDALVPGRRLAGVVEPGRIRFAFDTDSGTVTRGDSVWRVAPGTLAWAGGELYATTEGLGAALDIAFQADFGELILVASHTADLPVVRRLAREQRRRTLLGLPTSAAWETSLSQPRRVADGAVLDWTYTGSLTDPVSASLLQVGVGAQLLGGSLELQYAGQRSPAGGTTDFRSSWSGVWPGSRALRQVRLGDIVPGARRGRTLRGLELTNAPYLRPAAFGQEVIDGSLPDGWEVDLYQDQQLLGYSTAASGRYALDVPLRYGANPVDVVAYGPSGEVVHRRRTVQVPFDRLPKGRFEYAASGGACQGEPCAGALSLSARYGVTPWLTAEAGSDNFWRDSLADLWHPYALVSAAVTPSTGLTLEGVAHGLVRGRVDFDPTQDLHADLEHTRYADGVVSPLVAPGSERSRTDAVLFWRPRTMGGSSYLQLALSHAILTTGSRDAERIALTTRLSAVRLVTGIHHRRAPGAGAALDDLGFDAAGDVVLRGPGPVLQSLYLRGELSVETSGPSRLAVSLGRQIAGPLRLDLGTGWSRGQRGLALDLALSTNLPSLRAVSRSRYSASGGLEGTNLLEGSATYDRHLGRFEFGNGRLIGRARVVGRVYRDLNANGRHEPDEPGLPGVRLRVGSRGVTTDSLGRYSAWDLVPFEATSVEVDTLSITDPLWVPASLIVRLVPGPNAYEAVDMGLLPASEAAGQVVFGEDRAGVGGVPVLLRHAGSGAVIRTVTFSDGSFYAIGLRPGEYEASVPAETLDRLGADQLPVRFRADATGQPAEGLIIPLASRPAPAR
jgi:hypothetical protein